MTYGGIRENDRERGAWCLSGSRSCELLTRKDMGSKDVFLASLPTFINYNFSKLLF